jgi:hypothetical protein
MNANTNQTPTIQTVPAPQIRGLKRVAVTAEVAPAATKASKRPTTSVGGRAVKRYLQVCRRLKQLVAAKEQLETPVQSAGLKKLFAHNIANPTAPVTTVEVHDTTGAVAQVQFKDQYKAVDAEVAVAMFDKAGAVDANLYIHEIVTGKFDDSVFIVKDAAGKDEFSQERYDAFKKAIDEVAKKFNITTPVLTSATKIVPKSDFHTVRWSKPFGTVEQQETIHATLKATVACRAA